MSQTSLLNDEAADRGGEQGERLPEGDGRGAERRPEVSEHIDRAAARAALADETRNRLSEIEKTLSAVAEQLTAKTVRKDEILKALETRRTDVEAKLANFVKAISRGIFNASTAEAMNSLEAQKQELVAAIQAEHLKATLYEDEASIDAFYRRFAQATIDTPETHNQLFEYFTDKIYIGREQGVIASYSHDSATPIELEDLEEVLTSGNRAGKLRTYVRKQEFDSSTSSGA